MNQTGRTIVVVIGLAVLLLLETATFASFPGPLRFLPLTLAVGVYLVQLRGWWAGVWLIAIFGMLLDVLRLSPIPFQTLAYAAAATAVWMSAHALFSNRSLYGILGCGIAAWAAHGSVQSVVLFFQSLVDIPIPELGAYAGWMGWRLFLLLALLVTFFYLVPRKTRL